MSAFDGEIKIARAVSDPQTDHTLPSSKSLSWKAITTPTALAGTTGIHCELVHGDQWNELKGNHTENIARNQTLKVVGKHKETLVESCYQNIIGPQIVQNNTVRNETRLGKFSLIYGDNSTTQDSSGDQNVKPFDYSCTWVTSFECDTTKLEVKGAHGELTDLHAELVPIHAEFMGFHTEISGIHNSVVGGKNEATEDDNKAKTIEENFRTVNGLIAGVKNDVSAVESSVTSVRSHVSSLHSRTASMHNFLGLVELHTGPEAHTGPAVFAAIMGPGIL
jgi:hypothetical protein